MSKLMQQEHRELNIELQLQDWNSNQRLVIRNTNEQVFCVAAYVIVYQGSWDAFVYDPPTFLQHIVLLPVNLLGRNVMEKRGMGMI